MTGYLLRNNSTFPFDDTSVKAPMLVIWFVTKNQGWQPRIYFLLSEHMLCKESIVIVKKFDFEILMYLYILRFPEFIYAIFAVMYVFMCVCMCVCT